MSTPSLYSPEPQVNREIMGVILGVFVFSAIVALIFSYAP